MQIVLEGVDCTGKTTLGKKLANTIRDAYSATVHMEHEGLPPDVPSLFEHYAVKALTWNFCIHDRLHLGERTYGPVKRNRDNLGPIGQHIIDHIIRNHGFGLICAGSLPEVIKRWQIRRKSEYLQEMGEVAVIHRMYSKFYDGGDAWDIIDPFNKSDVERVLTRITHLKNTTDRINYQLGFGPSHANTLIVGEMSNHPTYDLPFFSTTGSSGYLIKTLIDLGIGHNYFLTNAYMKNGFVRDLRHIVRTLKQIRRVLALGRVATEELRKQEIPCISLPHPQFYYRFRHHHQVDYLKLFKIAMEADNALQLRLL